MYIKKSWDQIGVPKGAFQIAQQQDEQNRQAEIKRFNERNGITTTPQLSASERQQFLKDYITKKNQETQRLNEGEEAFNQTARRVEIESDERMQRDIESRKKIPGVYYGGGGGMGGGGGGGGDDFETPKVRKKIVGNATQPPKVSSQQKSLAQVGKELGWPGY